jgi:hypothetical protein
LQGRCNSISNLLKENGIDLANPNIELPDDSKQGILEILNPIMLGQKLHDDYMHPTPEALGKAASDSLSDEVIPKLSNNESLTIELTTWNAIMQVDSTFLETHLVQKGTILKSGKLIVCRLKTGGVLHVTPSWHPIYSDHRIEVQVNNLVQKLDDLSLGTRLARLPKTTKTSSLRY